MSASMLDRIVDGQTEVVFDYVGQGASADSADKNGVTLIQWCAYYGDVSAIRFLLSKGASIASLGADMGLNGAAFHGHWRLCQFLLDNGADANHSAEDTAETPLHSALGAAHGPGHDLVVQVLLAAGADPNRATRPNVETGAYMRDVRTKAETPLHRAAIVANEKTIQRLLDAGANVDTKDMNGETPLSWASWHCRPDAILRKLCYGEHRIRPGREPMADSLRGRPHTS